MVYNALNTPKNKKLMSVKLDSNYIDSSAWVAT